MLLRHANVIATCKFKKYWVIHSCILVPRKWIFPRDLIHQTSQKWSQPQKTKCMDIYGMCDLKQFFKLGASFSCVECEILFEGFVIEKILFCYSIMQISTKKWSFFQGCMSERNNLWWHMFVQWHHTCLYVNC